MTEAARHEKSKRRRLILSIELPYHVGFRLEGTRQTFRLTAQTGYELAVAQHRAEIDKKAKHIQKTEHLSRYHARIKAEKESRALLKPALEAKSNGQRVALPHEATLFDVLLNLRSSVQ